MFAGNIMRQPAYKDVEFRIASRHWTWPTSSCAAPSGWAPTLGLTEPMLDYIADSIREFITKA